MERVIKKHEEPVYRDEDGELLGFIVQEDFGWLAKTFFGYPIARTTSRADAEKVLREQGLSFLMGVWQYFDKSDRQWYPCVIKEANKARVTVIRTNEMGYQDPDSYKLVILEAPDEEVLIKSS